MLPAIDLDNDKSPDLRIDILSESARGYCIIPIDLRGHLAVISCGPRSVGFTSSLSPQHSKDSPLLEETMFL
jgi:hypothetical protein